MDQIQVKTTGKENWTLTRKGSRLLSHYLNGSITFAERPLLTPTSCHVNALVGSMDQSSSSVLLDMLGHLDSAHSTYSWSSFDHPCLPVSCFSFASSFA